MSTLLIQPLQGFSQRSARCEGAVVRPMLLGTDGEMPNGAVLTLQGRNVFANLRDLEEAISRVPRQRRDMLTHLEPHVPCAAPKGAGLSSITKRGFRTGSALIQEIAPPRSNVELSVKYSKPAESTSTGLEADRHGIQPKRQAVRNKSGEVVKPALRQGQCRLRPTGPKSVSFDTREHARHFFKVDPPLDIGNVSAPTDNCDYVAGDEQPTCPSPSYMFEVTVANSNRESTALETFPVYLERVWISDDHRCLMGSTVVANKAFQKRVSCRYTLDCWKTWSEATAEFSCKVRSGDTKIDRDRFTFTVKLLDSVDICSTTLCFCIRYNVDGQEYWDNNSGANFRVNIRKTYLQQIGKSFQHGSKTSDLSTQRPLAPGPKSTTPIFDNFRKARRADLHLKDFRANDMRSNDQLCQLLPNNLALTTRYSLDASLISTSHAKDTVVKRRP